MHIRLRAPRPPVQFGHFLLIRRLAVGGMAEVYLAEDTRSGARVALKRTLPHLARQPEFVRMFLNEARIAAQLDHPCIVQVQELGRKGQELFLTMELVKGPDLRRLMGEAGSPGLPRHIAAQIMASVCEGLDYAHHREGLDGKPLGIIHRDISPQNIMVGLNGQVKLLDFGIAKARALASRSNSKEMKGKYYYLSPEQIEREEIDSRSDIFAAGTVLFELAVGRNPFMRTTPEAALIAIRDEPIPSPGDIFEFPKALARIIDGCLQRDRKYRYQTAKDVERDLRSYLGQTPDQIWRELANFVQRALAPQTPLDMRVVKRAWAAPIEDEADSTLSLPPLDPESKDVPWPTQSASSKGGGSDGRRSLEKLPAPLVAPVPPPEGSKPPAAIHPVVLICAVVLVLGSGLTSWLAYRGDIPFLLREQPGGSLIFQAPQGTTVQAGRRGVETGRAYVFPAGPLEIRWECPRGGTKQNRMEEVAHSEVPALVTLKCPE